MITRTILRALRNELPMAVTFRKLGNDAPYAKHVDGRFRFICPHCGELLATVNPRNNLAHCFGCRRNINNIDLMIEMGYDFLNAVEILQHWLGLYNQEKALSQKKKTAEPHRSRDGPQDQPESVRDILRRQFGNAQAG